MPACYLKMLLAVMMVWIPSQAVWSAETHEATRNALLSSLQQLASDEFEGRGVGTEGLAKAAQLIAEEFRSAGLKVTAAGGDPFQEFRIVEGAELSKPNQLRFLHQDGNVIEGKLDESFRPCSFGQPGKLAGELVFCGYGIESKKPAYNDFEGVDVKGKVVIIIRRTPQQGNPHGMFAAGHGTSRHAALRTKVSNAFRHGASGILFVNDPFSDRNMQQSLDEQLEKAKQAVAKAAEALPDPREKTFAKAAQELRAALDRLKKTEEVLAERKPDPLMAFGYGGTKTGKSIPIMHIKQAVCDQLLQAALGKTLVQIEQEIDETGKPQSAKLEGWNIEGQVSFQLKQTEVSNVIGVLEGEGPHADETIIIGAHYDHLGYGGNGSLSPGVHEVHNGADDNASGTAALLELARRYGSRPTKPARRMVFIAFTGEERGLLGSARYVKEPLFPLEKTVAMFNMDMIGRLQDDKLTVFGTGTSSRWQKVLDAAAEQHGLALVKKPEGFGPSDHSSFYAKKIPVLHLFTGTHHDYHRPTDDWEKINVNGMVRIVQFLEQIVDETLQNEKRPDYIAIQQRATLTRSGNRPYFGSIPDFSTEEEGYALQGVAPGSPADKAGLKGGDVIIKLGDQAIGSLDDFDLALRKFSPGAEVAVTVRRDGKEITFRVVLATPRP